MTSAPSKTAAVAAALLLQFSPLPQALGQSAPADSAPTANLQTQSHEVLVELAVHDKRNRPVADLQNGQIEISDNGTPVKLTQLRHVSANQQGPALITFLFERPAAQENKQTVEERFFAAADPEKLLSDSAGKLLKQFPASGFEFAVMDVWGRLQIQQSYTGDAKAARAAIAEALKPGHYGVAVTATPEEKRLAQIAQMGQDAEGKAASTRDRAMARALVAALNRSAHVRKDQHLPGGLASLLALVESQQGISGRKAVLYFTLSSTSANSQEKSASDSQSKAALQTVIGAANRAGVNVYVVRVGDASTSREMSRMLQSFATMSTGQTMSDPSKYYSYSSTGQSGGGGFAQAKNEMYMSPAAFRMIASKRTAEDNLDGLDALAESTGGAVLQAEQEFTGPVREMTRDLTSYYEASYAPPNAEEDGSFHTIDVKPVRPGLKIRARSGYLALPASAGLTEPPQAYELPLMALLNRPELPEDLKYQASVLRLGHQENGTMNAVAVELPLKELEKRLDGNSHLASAHVAVLATLKDSTGTVIERFSEDMARRWTDGEERADETVSFVRSFSAPPGDYELETALEDKFSGKGAARRQKVRIAEPGGYPELSEPVLVRSSEPAPADEAGFNPLLYGEQQIAPDLSGELPTDGRKIGIYLLAHTDPQLAEAGEVKLEVLHEGEPLKGAVLVSPLKAGAELHTVLNSFAIPAPPAGEYQLRATLTQGGKSSVSTGRFRVPEQASTAVDGAKLVGDPPTLTATAESAARPTGEELNNLLDEARKAALSYQNSLPNLICQQQTHRYTSSNSGQSWHEKDLLVELLTYVDHEEDRIDMGQIEKGAVHTADKVKRTGVLSAGEFGQALTGIFLPASKAQFEWKQSGSLRGEAVEVFEYKITRANSTFSLRANAINVAMAGYHGRLYIDRATHGVRSLTLITDDVPKGFPLQQVAVRIDYDYVAMSGRDLLLPVDAQIVAGGKAMGLERNDLQFTNFRRYGSSARIVNAPEGEKP